MKTLPFKILIKETFQNSQVQIKWVEEENLSRELSKKIDDYWQNKILPGPKGDYVFNGPLCSLNNWRIENATLFLELRRTDYKTMLYSNFVNRNPETHGSFNSNALGISAVIVSADDEVVLMQRSQEVGESAGMIDVIGGHIEPGAHDLDGVPNPFVGIEAEIEEEVGLTEIPAKKLICIGLLETMETRKPELVFQHNSELSADEIISLARKIRTTEAAHFFYVKNNADAIERMVYKNRKTFSPSAMGCLYLFAGLA